MLGGGSTDLVSVKPDEKAGTISSCGQYVRLVSSKDNNMTLI